MGAQTFLTVNKGLNLEASKAFWDLVTEAQFLYGNVGYTGTIAEKYSFKMVDVPKGKDPIRFAHECLEDENGWWNDKWEPAACIEVTGAALKKMRGEEYKGKRNFKAFIFFGWASS
jgi:hypothetical protein